MAAEPLMLIWSNPLWFVSSFLGSVPSYLHYLSLCYWNLCGSRH